MGFALIFHPTRRLVKYNHLPLPDHWEKNLRPHQLLQLKGGPQLQRLFLNGRAFSRNQEKSFWVAGWGLGLGSTLSLRGFSSGSPGSWVTHPRVNILNHDFKFQEEDSTTGSSLKLSSDTWKRVHREEQNRREAQRIRENLLVETPASQLPCFRPPLNSFRVSAFASPRRLPNQVSYRHTGVDFRARVGTPIPAAADGQVVLAEPMLIPGKMVTLDHGLGIYSQYYHLSKIKVRVQQKVKAGEILGLSGATGRVEGPHLHWEILWKALPLNPQEVSQAFPCEQ